MRCDRRRMYKRNLKTAGRAEAFPAVSVIM